MDRASRIPDLAFPFGALGALLGWVFADALKSPTFHGAADINPCLAAVGGAATAALLGARLTHRAHAEAEGAFLPSVSSRWLTLGPPLCAGGALTGALVGLLVNNIWAGGILGAGCALLAVPLCAAVLAAALRAERARFGSLVADADRREVWASLVMAASIATLVDLPGAIAWAALGRPFPWPSLAIAVAALPLLLVLHLLDRSARRSLAAATLDLTAREQERAPASELPLLDLGLGDELQARYAPGSSAYRDHPREVAVVRGNPDEARGALDRAVRRGAACIALATLALAAYAVALGPSFRLPYAMSLCDRREGDGCAGAARVLAARDAANPEVGRLYLRGCAHTRVHCAELVAWFEAHPELEHDQASASTLHEACAIGHGPACAAAAGVAERAGDAARAESLLRSACRRGYGTNCGHRAPSWLRP